MANNMKYENYEKLDMIGIYYQVGFDTNRARNIYFERYVIEFYSYSEYQLYMTEYNLLLIDSLREDNQV